MKLTRASWIACGLILLAPLPACAVAGTSAKTLTAFASEQELTDVLKKYVEHFKRQQARRAKAASGAVMQEAAPAALAEAKAVADNAESVTNTQTAGVDEGGIVKVHGKHLVILRRGRLFTVALGEVKPKPVDAVDAFGPDIEPGGTWYDEMLIADDTVVVIGYSYARGGTEIGLFDIDGQGRIAYRATYHLRSNDYYSSRNYASRLIGNKLIFYTPLQVSPWLDDPLSALPAVRQWKGNATARDFTRIAPATRIYRTDEPLDPDAGLALHTVTTCDLGKREMDCQASAVLGPPGRVFYVSTGSVYVWTTSYRPAGTASAVFRLPLDGSAPTALKTAGSPIDQFSFLESGDGYLNVLVRADGRGEAMWAAERGAGDLALMRVSLDRFSDGRDSVAAENYQPLPKPAGYDVQNRYVGSFLLYGAGSGWGYPQDTPSGDLYSVRWDKPSKPQVLALGHAVDRIEALGKQALVVGAVGNDLHLSTVRLGKRAAVASRFVRENAAQGETRSHGFFYKPDNAWEGILGLPIVSGGEPGYKQLRRASAAVLFLRNSGLELSDLGRLRARPNGASDDGCRASCVDWYGNSRPLFLRGRLFALMGYELVEGRIGQDDSISEVGRVDFSPLPRGLSKRGG
jgi:hypothetical protein